MSLLIDYWGFQSKIKVENPNNTLTFYRISKFTDTDISYKYANLIIKTYTYRNYRFI